MQRLPGRGEREHVLGGAVGSGGAADALSAALAESSADADADAAPTRTAPRCARASRPRPAPVDPKLGFMGWCVESGSSRPACITNQTAPLPIASSPST